jgi:ribosomal protein S27AE
MPDPDREATIRAALADLARGFASWEQTHPSATLSEAEGALDAAMARTRAEVLSGWAHAQPSARLADQPVASRPTCPTCGTALVADGRHRRTLTLAGDQPLELERDYARCPVCGQGLFPPG